MDLFTVLRNIYLKIKKNINVERITNSEIDDAFGGAAGTTIKAQDYVIEYGTSGNWHYRKWASGKAEAAQTQVYTSSSSSVAIITTSQINSLFGVTNAIADNTMLIVANGDGSAQAAHVEGGTFQAGTWYAVFDRTVSGSIRINSYLIYFG